MNRLVSAVTVVAVLVGGGLWWSASDGGYDVTVVFPSAPLLVSGSPVQVAGTQVGTVEGLSVEGGKAMVRIGLDEAFAPVHAGTTARIEYKALLGERIVALEPGDRHNPPIPSGGVVVGGRERVELDHVLDALDPPTRERLVSLVAQLDETVTTRPDAVRDTLATGGPAVEALGEVLAAVGDDGPALRDLVLRVRDLAADLNGRRGEVRTVVDGLDGALSGLAGRHEALAAALQELPATLEQADETLARVPAAADAATGLLEDLRPATTRLPALAADLRPLVADARATMADLRPAMGALQSLLGHTPRTLDLTASFVPRTEELLGNILPVLAFARPYTPEVAGAVSNLASAAAGYDANGHYVRVYTGAGGASFNSLPATPPPGLRMRPDRPPGALEDQPWTDAHGSEIG